jgi:hypothetical protein
MGCSSRLIVGEDATREVVVAALESTIERLVDGDFLLVSYAGHMTTLAGIGDDPDGWDEAWCLDDGILLDDELHDLLAEVPAGCDVLVVTDSCFAGGAVDGETVAALQALPGPLSGDRLPEDPPTLRSVLRRAGAIPAPPRPAAGRPEGVPVVGLPPGADQPVPFIDLFPVPDRALPDDIHLIPRAPKARLGDLAIGELVRRGAIPRGESIPASRRRPIVASVVAVAGAAEGSLAFEGTDHGLLTAALLEVDDWLGDRTVSYETWLEILAGLLPFQRPALGVFGGATRTDALRPALASSAADPIRLRRRLDANRSRR